MKKMILCVTLLFTVSTVFCQGFMHGVGITVMGSSTGSGNFSYGEGFTYSPRFNFLETEQFAVGVGIPLSIAVSASTSTYTTSIGFVINAPLIISLNMGRGSSKACTKKFGYFFGAGFGYHHGDFLVDDYDPYSNSVLVSRSLNTFGPAGNAGVRFGVGRKHKNIEVRLSYMKGLNDTKPNIFGVAGLFNF